MRLHEKKLQNATNIISDPKKPIETLHVLQKLRKSVVPYILILDIAVGIDFNTTCTPRFSDLPPALMM